nr:SOS response-associated peptidase [Alkalicoccus daliensis]
MCGRFTFITDIETLGLRYDLGNAEKIETAPRYNVAPTQSIVTIVHDGKHHKAGKLRWGLIPSFAKDTKMSAKMINARAETLDEKPSFKKLLSRRRCVIVADSFYEWKKIEGKKQPYRIQVKDQPIFAMAGLWDRWQSENGEEINSCTIITTEANDFMQDLHHRMPVILSKEAESIWLDRSVTEAEKLKPLLQPFAGEMTAYEVPVTVNSPQNDDPSVIEAV